jgi:hypothetical protein
MTDEQATDLKKLSEQAFELEAFQRNLDRAEAARRIAARGTRSAPRADAIGGEPRPRIMIGVADQSLDAISIRFSAYAVLARFLPLAAAFVLFAVRFHQVRF